MSPDEVSQASAPASTTEATNAKMLNQTLGKVLTALGDSSTDVLAALAAIASAITASIIGGTTGGTANRVLTAKGTTGRALQASGASVDSSGNINTNGGDLTVDDITADDISAQDGAFSATLTKGGASLAIVTQTVGCSFTFKSPENETVYLILNSQFAWTITSTVTITEAGSSQIAVSNNGSALSGNSATTSQQTVAQNSAVAVSSYVAVAFTSTSSDCENLCLTIWGTRVLAS